MSRSTAALCQTLRESAALCEDLVATCNEAADKIERLLAWVDDLQSGLYINCVYCGHRYGPGETTPVSMADALKAHIAQCPDHPMSDLVKTLTAASRALREYGCGDAAPPDLAWDIAEAADAALAFATEAAHLLRNAADVYDELAKLAENRP